ncbi:protein lifeguard 3-like protein [Leptotrombidium deliense]|uniref:Protein lifeguard 3-like protein n=1 Tax=Leptotrombidium deliense TaxID=299467 RepID=A0A443SH21_9ACAR|nr:protein lifeguard 3-like protein [Leptotrombidium deliense]
MAEKSKGAKQYTVIVVEQPKSNDSAISKEPEFGPGFGDKEVRRNFVWKVYSILTIQLIFTITIAVAMLIQFVYVSHNNEINHLKIKDRYAGILRSKSLVGTHCNTLLQGFAIGVISCSFETAIFVLAMGTTTITVIVITVLAASDLFDITKCGLLLLVLTIVHMIMLIVGIIIIIAFNVNFRIVHLVLSIAGAFLFSLWLAYDTQLILGGKSHEMSPEDYIYGAIALYIDITQIFLFMLAIFGGGR